jgi:spermidine export protein MdtJ
VAYGAWESLGLVLITLCSFWLFSETLSVVKLVAIAVIIIGIVLLERGTEEQPHSPSGGDHAA